MLAVKIGVIPQWTKDGKRFFTTMLQVNKLFIALQSSNIYVQFCARVIAFPKLKLKMVNVVKLVTHTSVNNAFIGCVYRP